MQPERRQSPALIAQRILAAPDNRQSSRTLRNVEAMCGLSTLADATAYDLVASVRRDIGGWRSLLAREIKNDLDTILTLYRVQRWGEDGSVMTIASLYS